MAAAPELSLAFEGSQFGSPAANTMLKESMEIMAAMVMIAMIMASMTTGLTERKWHLPPLKVIP